jgi:hypothetical protein
MARKKKDPNQMDFPWLPKPNNGKAPRVKRSKTSAAAGDSVEPSLASMEGQVLELFRMRAAHGCTDDEIEVELGMKHQTASARRRTLELKGFIVLSAMERPTRSGRMAGVYTLKGVQL